MSCANVPPRIFTPVGRFRLLSGNGKKWPFSGMRTPPRDPKSIHKRLWITFPGGRDVGVCNNI